MSRRIIILFLITVISVCESYAQDTITYSILCERVEQLSSQMCNMQSRQNRYVSQTSELTASIAAQQAKIDSLQHSIDEYCRVSMLSDRAFNDSLTSVYHHLDTAVTRLSRTIHITLFLVLALVILSCLAVVALCIVHSHHAKDHRSQRTSIVERLSTIESLHQTLHNKIVSLDGHIAPTIATLTSAAPQKKMDHSLAIAVANELVRIQQNLNHMDPTVKGVSQLKNRTNAILSTLNSKQYDIPNLLGREYHEGDTIIATMEYNEAIEVGRNRIKRVIKPQISYAGKLIQAAEVVVEYNE